MSRLRAGFIRNEWLRGYTLLSPTLLVMICALALPIFSLVIYSFWTQEYVHVDKTLTLGNYRTFFEKWMYSSLLLRSIRMSATVTLITILLAYPVAYFLAFKVRKNIMTWLILINLPFWTSYLLRVLAWKIMLGNSGVINSTLLDLEAWTSSRRLSNSCSTAAFAVILTLVHGWAAFAILPIYLSLSKIDRSLLEAAADLGEGPVRRFLQGHIAAVDARCHCRRRHPVHTDGGRLHITPMMVGGPKGMMFGQIIAAQFGEANNWPLGSALTHDHDDDRSRRSSLHIHLDRHSAAPSHVARWRRLRHAE